RAYDPPRATRSDVVALPVLPTPATANYGALSLHDALPISDAPFLFFSMSAAAGRPCIWLAPEVCLDAGDLRTEGQTPGYIRKFLPRYTLRTASLSMISLGWPLVSTRPSLMM